MSCNYRDFKIIAANCQADDGTNSMILMMKSDICHYLQSRRLAAREGDVCSDVVIVVAASELVVVAAMVQQW